jgi:hypothetical protein
MPDLGYEDEPVENIQVATTFLAFHNFELIELLNERGKLVKNEQWDKMYEIHDKINELKNKHFMQLVRPCNVFMTFQCEEGVNRALKMNEIIADSPDCGVEGG